jgi:hypothetical protein
MRVAITLLAIILAVIIAGCATTTDRLPAIGQAIYCPSCNADLYQRISGTSRTSYKRTDYSQMRYDCPAPLPGAEHICPLCGADIVIWGDPIEGGEGRYIARVYYRDRK